MFNKSFRLLKKYYYKILRSNGTPHSLAISVALGFFVGCFVPTGGHTVIVLLLAFLFKADKILAFAATWIANPYTITFLYPFFCFVGARILGIDMTFQQIDREIMNIIHDFSWHNLILLGEELAFSFFVGGFIFGIILGGIGYYFTYRTVLLYRNKRVKRKENKLQY
jgi:uncharacterized protein